MPGTRCRVECCKNSLQRKGQEVNVSFHKFPRDPQLRHKWIKFTRKPGPWNPESSFICSDHFAPDEFVRNLRSELLNLPPSRRLLKKTAVPTLFDIHKKLSEVKEKRNKRYEERERKRIVDELLAESERQEKLTKSLEEVGLQIPPKPIVAPITRKPSPVKKPPLNQSAYGLYVLEGPPYTVIAQPVGKGSSKLHPILPKPLDISSKNGSESCVKEADIIVQKVIVNSNETRKEVLLNKAIMIESQSSIESGTHRPTDPESPLNSQPVILLPGSPPDEYKKNESDPVNDKKVNNFGSPQLSSLKRKLSTALKKRVKASFCHCGLTDKRESTISQLKEKVAELTNDLKNKDKIIKQQMGKIKKLATELVKFKTDKLPTSYIIESETGDDLPTICYDHCYAITEQKAKGKGSKSENPPPPVEAQAQECTEESVQVFEVGEVVEGGFLEMELASLEDQGMMYILPCDNEVEPLGMHSLDGNKVVVEAMNYS